MHILKRRSFLKASTASLALFSQPFIRHAKAESPQGDVIPLEWLKEGLSTASFQGTTFGVAWPRGRVRPDTDFIMEAGQGPDQPVQSWVNAWWPDGSVKWSAHAIAPLSKASATHTRLRAVTGGKFSPQPDIAQKTGASITVRTGALEARFSKGKDFLSVVHKTGTAERTLHVGGILSLDHQTKQGEETLTRSYTYHADVQTITIEGNGSDRAVIKVEGTHRAAGQRPDIAFTMRFYFYRNSASIRLVHTLIYDLAAPDMTLRGVGLRMSTRFSGPAYERYIRFVTAEGGVFAEALQPLTGLRRDPGERVRAAQINGGDIPEEDEWSPRVRDGMEYVPTYGDYDLTQLTSDGFLLRKRTGEGQGWITAHSGKRAAGTMFLGDRAGGVALGIRDFWQGFPASLSVENGGEDVTDLTAWLYSPEAPAMDMAPYNKPHNENDYAAQRKALDITYEDYEPGFSTAIGIGRTSELLIEFTEQTPGAEDLVDIAQRVSNPPFVRQSRTSLYNAQATHVFWHAEGQDEAKSGLNKSLDSVFDYYRNQAEQRRWYGFWNYGDIMHSYDADRHAWRYDIGGFAWDNGELSSLMWLWAYYLHKGTLESFRFAEAMTRHITEVDVYHTGRFALLGSRHNVQHWGDSAKQLRISTVANAKLYYFLTSDERMGELLHAQVNAVERLQEIVPGRKLKGTAASVAPAHYATVSFGTDWGAVAAAWFLEWERTGHPQWKEKLSSSMQTIAAQPHGFFTGVGIMELKTGRFVEDHTGAVSVSHLSAMFGLPETCSEILNVLPQPEFQKAWLEYCVYYLADAKQQAKKFGSPLQHASLKQAHARLLGYAGKILDDSFMRRKAWEIFARDKAGLHLADIKITHLTPPVVAEAVDEAPRLSTNAVAQWALGAIGLMAVAPKEENVFYDAQ